MSEQKQLTRGEVRKTIATALAAAFGFVIALLWKEVVTGGLVVAGINTSLDEIDLGGWLVYLVTAVLLTVFMVLMIIIVSRWGSK